MRFLLDNDVPDRVAGVLGAAGHDVVRLREILPPDSDDAAVLDPAAAQGCVLVTCNRDDFLSLARTGRQAGIIVLIRRRTRIAECAALLRLIQRAGAEGLEGNINFA